MSRVTYHGSTFSIKLENMTLKYTISNFKDAVFGYIRTIIHAEYRVYDMLLYY